MTNLEWPDTPWCIAAGDDDDDEKMVLLCKRCNRELTLDLPISIDEGTKYMHLFCTIHQHCEEGMIEVMTQ